MTHQVTPPRSLCVALVIAALFASPFAVTRASAVRSLLEIRQENVVVQQWDMSCGAAALATVLTYQLGAPISEKRVAQGMLRSTDPLRVRHRGGFSLLDMKKYARSRGFQAQGYGGLTLENLRKFAPLIVPVHLENYDHFVVFRGVAAGYAVFADPGFGNRKLPLAEFEKVWNGGIGFVISSQADPANRMSPRQTDLLAVEAEVVRASLDSALPAPLNDWQMRDLPWLDNLPGPAEDSDENEVELAEQLSDGEAEFVVAAGPSPITRIVNKDPAGAALTPVASTIDAVTTAVDSVGVNTVPVVTAVSTSLSNAVAAVTQPVPTVAAAASEPISTGIQPVTAAVNSVTTAAAPVTDVVEAATQPVSVAVSATAPIAESAASTVASVVKPVTEAVSIATSTIAAAVEPVSAAIEPVAKTARKVVSSTEPAVASAAESVSTATKAVNATASVDTAAKPVTGTVNKVVSKAARATEASSTPTSAAAKPKTTVKGAATPPPSAGPPTTEMPSVTSAVTNVVNRVAQRVPVKIAVPIGGRP